MFGAAELKAVLWKSRDEHCPNSPPCSMHGDQLMGEDWCPACRVVQDVESALIAHALKWAGSGPSISEDGIIAGPAPRSDSAPPTDQKVDSERKLYSSPRIETAPTDDEGDW